MVPGLERPPPPLQPGLPSLASPAVQKSPMLRGSCLLLLPVPGQGHPSSAMVTTSPEFLGF